MTPRVVVVGRIRVDLAVGVSQFEIGSEFLEQFSLARLHLENVVAHTVVGDVGKVDVGGRRAYVEVSDVDQARL